MEQSQVKHKLLYCARVLLGNIWRIFNLKISDTGMPKKVLLVTPTRQTRLGTDVD